MKRKVQIYLPTLPFYRNEFFAYLSKSNRGKYDLNIYHGDKFNNKEILYKPSHLFQSKKFSTIEFKFLGFNLSWQKGVISTFIKNPPDGVVILFNPGIITFWIIILLSKIKKIPIALWGSGYIRPEIQGLKQRFRERLHKLLMSSAEVYITYGAKYALYLTTIFPQKKVIVAQNTINIEKIIDKHNSILKQANREKLGIDINVPMFLFVGAITKGKKLEMAIEAMNKLKQTGYNFYYYIIGNGENKAILQKMIINNNLQDNIIVLEAIYDDKLSKYYYSADLFLLPGTGGLAVNEAMAYGLPVIAGVGDGTILDLIIDDENGYILNDKINSQGLYDILKKFIELEYSKKQQMGEKSMEIIKDKALLENMVQRYSEAINLLFNDDDKL